MARLGHTNMAALMIISAIMNLRRANPATMFSAMFPATTLLPSRRLPEQHHSWYFPPNTVSIEYNSFSFETPSSRLRDVETGT